MRAHTRRPRSVIVVACGILAAGRSLATERPPASPSPSTEAPAWLVGDLDRRFALVEKHLRGLDVTMVEIGHRYVELYWSGKDRNWGYAEYQLGKMELALANGVERRPKRAASARMIEGPVQALKEAIASRDSRSFEERFTSLTVTCNDCHQVERVPFIRIAPPAYRMSPVAGSQDVPPSPDPGVPR